MEMINAVFVQKSLIGELTQGREMANQLKNQLDPEESREACQDLLENIISTYNKTLSLLNSKGLNGGVGDQMAENSHQSLGGSPPNHASKNQDFQKHVHKKRKTEPQWNEQVRVCSGTGLECPLDDGHSWRKYGQKDILGAKFPRGYYRCTHRKTQGCLATKKVQRSDGDSSIFQVTYKGRHTCVQSSNSSSTSVQIEEKNKLKPRTSLSHIKRSLPDHHDGFKIDTNVNYDLIMSKVPSNQLRVENQCMISSREEIFGSTSFAPMFTQIESAESSMESRMFLKEDDNLMDYLLAPTTSDSDYFSLEWQVNDFGSNGIMQSSEFEVTADTSPTSVNESPFNQVDFDATTFDFETLRYFS